MSDENLRMQAEVTDGFTAPLGRMETALRRTGVLARQVGKDAQKDFEGFHGVLGKTRAALEGMTPALSAMGVGSIGAGLAVSGFVTALRGFSVATRDVAILSKEVGLASNELRALGRIGEDFGVSAQTMQGGVKNFAGEMDRLRRRWGETYIELEAMNLGDLVEKLVAAPNMRAALEAAMDALGNIGNPVKRRKVAEMLFGVSEMSQVASGLKGRVKQEIDEVINDIGRLDPATEKAATDFEKHMGRIGDAAERLKLGTLGPVLKGIVGIIDDLDKNGLRGNEQEQALRNQLSPFGGSGPTAQQRLESRRSSVQQQLDLLDRNPSAPDYQRKRDRMVEELKRVADELEKLRNQGATVQQQRFNGPAGGGALIQKAALGGLGYGGGGGGFGGLSGMGQGYGYGAPSGGDTSSPRAGSGGSSAPLGRNTRPLDGGGASPPLQGGGALPSRAGGQFTSAPAGPAGRYRPQRTLTDRDLSDAVVSTIAGEARLSSREGVDAVINNMFNRLGSKGWGPSRDLQDVAFAPGQYAGAGRGRPTAAQAAFIRDRIRAIASGGVPDNTGGSNSFRASWYRGPWWRRFGQYGKDFGGNTFAYDPSIRNGPYAPYPTPKAGETAESPRGAGGDDFGQFRAFRERLAREGRAPTEEEDDTVTFDMWKKRQGGAAGAGADASAGDRAMRRFYGNSAPDGPRFDTARGGKGSLTIEFKNAPSGMKQKASMSDLFDDVSVSKSVQLARLA